MDRFMTETPVESVEHKIRSVINYLWAMGGKIDPERFAIGVDFVGWEELGADAKTAEMTFDTGKQVFFVIPLQGLPEGTVALVWRENK